MSITTFGTSTKNTTTEDELTNQLISSNIEFISFMFKRFSVKLSKRIPDFINNEPLEKPLVDLSNTLSEFADYLRDFKKSNPKEFDEIAKPRIDMINLMHWKKVNQALKKELSKISGYHTGAPGIEVMAIDVVNQKRKRADEFEKFFIKQNNLIHKKTKVEQQPLQNNINTTTTTTSTTTTKTTQQLVPELLTTTTHYDDDLPDLENF